MILYIILYDIRTRTLSGSCIQVRMYISVGGKVCIYIKKYTLN